MPARHVKGVPFIFATNDTFLFDSLKLQVLFESAVNLNFESGDRADLEPVSVLNHKLLARGAFLRESSPRSVSGSNIFNVHIIFHDVESSMQIGKVLIVDNRQVVFGFPADFVKIVLVQRKFKGISDFWAFIDDQGHRNPVLTVFDVVHQELVAAHFDDHAAADLTMLLNFDKGASGAFAVF